MSGTRSEETLGGATASSPFATGSRVGAGRYQVIRFIDKGGMGEVYEVEDLVIGGRVALKTLRSDRAGSTTAVQRLRREIALARKVTHPNVCRVHDVGEHEGSVFLTMELLEGETLASRVRREGALPVAELERVAREMIGGLAALHDVGIVHRDLKSSNVMVVDKRVVITDFGLARTTSGDHESLTDDRAVLGTPSYMAPEQVEGAEATPASDIYALGVVLYELATGELPFRGDTALATAAARLTSSPPRAQAKRSDIPAQWDAAIARCLSRDPAKRFARASDILPATPTRRWKPWWVVALVLALAVIAATVFVVTRTLEVVRPPRLQVEYHLERNEFAAARTILERLVAEHPNDPWVHFRLALALSGLEEELADKHFSLAYEKRATSSEADRLRVEVRMMISQGNHDGAIATYDRLAALAPSNVTDNLDRVWLLENAGRNAEALASLRELSAAAPADPRVPLAESYLIRVSDQERARALAAESFTKAKAIGARVLEAEALQRLAWTDANLGNLVRAEEEAEGARRRFAEVGHRKDVLDTLNALSLVRFNRGRYRESVASQQTAIELSTERKNHHILNQAIGRAMAGEAEPAYAAVRTMTTKNAVDATAQGWVAERAGDHPAARAYFDEARKRLDAADHFSAALLNWRSGVLYAAVGDHASARRDLEATIANAGPAGMLSVGSQARIALAQVALAVRDHRAAEALARQGFDEQRKSGSVAGIGTALAVVAEARLAAGDTAGARAALKEANDVRAQIQDPVELADIDRVAKLLR